MPHDFYVRFTIVFVIGLPTLMVFVTGHVLGRPKARINLPNRDYWLAPERRAETIAFLHAGLIWFGVLLVTLLCYMHWLVVVANSVQPPRLSEPWFFGGLVVSFVALLVWLKVLLGHFRVRA